MRKASSGASNKHAAAVAAPPVRPSVPLKRTTSARSHNQSALSNFWELPPSVTSKAPSRVQSIISTSMSTNPGMASKQASGIGLKTPGTILRQRRSAKTASASTSQIIKIDDSTSQNLECIELEPALPTRKKPRNTPATASSISRRAVVASKPASILIPVRVDDSDDDFVETLSKRKPSKHCDVISDDSSDVQPVDRAIEAMRIASTPVTRSTKLARKRSVEEVCLPSSPPLLRHGSPTVERHNSQTQSMLVLDTTSNAAGTTKELPGFSSAADLFSQETLVASISRANTATGHMNRTSSASTIANHHLEVMATKASVQQFGRNTSASKEALKGVDSELFYDPIDEYLTQDVGWSSQMRSSFAPRLSPLASDTYNSEKVHVSATAGLAGRGEPQQDRSSPFHPGISQWYHDNHDRVIGLGEDSDGAELFANDQLGDDLNSGEELSGQEPAPQGYVSIDDEDSDEAPQSPLEGFCDLREYAGTGGGDMDIYLNQFAPTVRQSSQRGGRGRRRGSSATSASRRTASSSRERPSSSGSTRGGRRGRGHQTAAAGFGGIRPVASSRPSHTTTAAAAAAAATSAPIIYNHYADDGYLDIAPSMYWEGNGMSRFG